MRGLLTEFVLLEKKSALSKVLGNLGTSVKIQGQSYGPAMKKIDGVTVDIFTQGAIRQVYNNVADRPAYPGPASPC